MIEFIYRLLWIIPSLLFLVLGNLANLMAAFSEILGDLCNSYFISIYGVEKEDDE